MPNLRTLLFILFCVNTSVLTTGPVDKSSANLFDFGCRYSKHRIASFDPKSQCYTEEHCYVDSTALICSNSNITSYINYMKSRSFNNPHFTVLFESTKIKKIEKNKFGDERIIRLLLNNISIETIEDEAFSKLRNLKKLELQNNKIKYITDKTFDGLISLEHLQLDNNLIQKVSSEMFKKLVSLRKLCLYGNPIKTFEFKGPLSMYRITNVAFSCATITHRNIIKLEKGTFKKSINYFKHLVLINNGLISIEEQAFDGLPMLEKLTINSQNIEKLPSKAFDGLSELTELNLSDNNITLLETGIVEAKLPETSENVKTGTFYGLRKLKILKLDHNKIITISSYTFNNLNSLEELNLNDNLIQYIENNAFFGLENLKHLNLKNNALTFSQSNSFNGLNNLITLDLSNNRIEKLEPVILSPLKKLELLNIFNNNLQHVSYETIQTILPNLKKLILNDNE